ncbi:MAG: redoxin domain-containing protein [Porticoccaceae bacterium]|nr:redoxin domain-containing protein [Porticoccaceae bacterium]
MKIKPYLLIGCALALLVGCDNAPVPQETIAAQAGFSDVPGSALEVGSAAPDFKLQSLNGDWISLSELQGNKVLIIFFRGHWCPFCVGHLQDIQTVLPALEKLGYQILAISPDDAGDMQKMADRMDRPYQFLSDIDLSATDLYGIRNDKDLPHPAMILLDQKGLVQWFYIGEDYKTRPSAAQLKQVLDRLNP